MNALEFLKTYAWKGYKNHRLYKSLGLQILYKSSHKWRHWKFQKKNEKSGEFIKQPTMGNDGGASRR